MNAKILLYNSLEETLEVEIDYEIERVKQGWYQPDDVEISRCVILTDLKGFQSSDIETDVEEGIRMFESVTSVRLKCKVEYASDKKWSRIAIMNKRTCELLKVA